MKNWKVCVCEIPSKSLQRRHQTHEKDSKVKFNNLQFEWVRACMRVRPFHILIKIIWKGNFQFSFDDSKSKLIEKSKIVLKENP